MLAPDAGTMVDVGIGTSVLELSLLDLPAFTERVVLWHGETLVCYTSASEHQVRPSPDAWAAFWAALDRLAVWEWRETYAEPDVLDGRQWSLAIVHGGRELLASGASAEPPEFARFLETLDRLVDGWLSAA
jgi:hypothetical protein